MATFGDIYRNKKVAVTGGTGFKGSWLSLWLGELGAEVHGIANGVPTEPSHFKAAALDEHLQFHKLDIRDLPRLQRALSEIEPDFVFHLAAQPLVRRSHLDPVGTLGTNIMGSTHVLEALRQIGRPVSAVMITSDKCYRNVEWTWGYRETDELGGDDPYSASKGAAELVIRTYVQSYFNDPASPVKVAIGRAGNAIGGGDWAADRIVPDCIRAWSSNQPVEIRSPRATRPWQHVLEPLSGCLELGRQLAGDSALNGEPFNFGPGAGQNFQVSEVLEAMQRHWPGSNWHDVSDPHALFECTLLKLCCDKALHRLAWSAVLTFEETIRLTVDWYRQYYERISSERLLDVSKAQIVEYTEFARQRGVPWADAVAARIPASVTHPTAP